MITEPLTYTELNKLAQTLRNLGGDLRNGKVTARDAWQIVEDVADAIGNHSINTMIADVAAAKEA